MATSQKIEISKAFGIMVIVGQFIFGIAGSFFGHQISINDLKNADEIEKIQRINGDEMLKKDIQRMEEQRDINKLRAAVTYHPET